jgi:hypothetical protein
MFDSQIDESLVDNCGPLWFGHFDRETIIRRELDVVANSELPDHHVFLGHKPDELLPSNREVRRAGEGQGRYFERSFTTSPFTLMVPSVLTAFPVTRLMMVVFLRGGGLERDANI